MPTIKYKDKDGNIIGESGPLEFYQYEKEMIEEYEAGNYYAVNKCRGAGESEIITVRHMAYKYCTTRIPDRKCLIVAGLNVDAALELMYRIKLLLDTIPFIYKIEPKGQRPLNFSLQFGRIIALPANPNILRLFENVGDVLIEESAFWSRVDDTPVLLAAEPHVAKSSAIIGSLTTPNGKRGFVWTKIFDPDIKTKYRKHILNWREVCGLPEPNPETISEWDEVNSKVELSLDVHDRELVRQIYKKRYEVDINYRDWFDEFFEGKSIDRIVGIGVPVLNPEEVLASYHTDRAKYDQEYDNQFIVSENKAFGIFSRRFL